MFIIYNDMRLPHEVLKWRIDQAANYTNGVPEFWMSMEAASKSANVWTCNISLKRVRQGKAAASSIHWLNDMCEITRYFFDWVLC